MLQSIFPKAKWLSRNSFKSLHIYLQQKKNKMKMRLLYDKSAIIQADSFWAQEMQTSQFVNKQWNIEKIKKKQVIVIFVKLLVCLSKVRVVKFMLYGERKTYRSWGPYASRLNTYDIYLKAEDGVLRWPCCFLWQHRSKLSSFYISIT